MKIIAPASTLEDVREYNKLCVDEIYLGYRDKDDRWNITNKRGGKNANFSKIEDIKKIKKICNCEVSLTLNQSYYDQDTIQRSISQIISLKDYVDNFIVSDPSMIGLIKKYAPDNKIVLSCIAACLNNHTVEFYRKMDVKRIVLPRHLTLEEIHKLVQDNKDIEFEVMILNQFCNNIDAFCSRCHIPCKNGDLSNCNIPYTISVKSISGQYQNSKVKHNIESITRFNPKCGMCFIKDLEKWGLYGVKIVGRSNHISQKIDDARMIDMAIKGIDKQDFKKHCKELFEDKYKRRCHRECYY